MTISLATSYIADVSMDAYTVGDSGTITETRYTVFLNLINSRLSKDGLLDSDGSLKSGCEYLAALLVCDMIKSGQTQDTGIIEETFEGGYKYKKTQGAAESPVSKFMQRYEAEIAMRTRGSAASSGQVRADYEIEFAKLSQGTPPYVDDTSGDYPSGM